MATTLEDLPPELLVKIFSQYVGSEGHVAFLRNIPSVCKVWRDFSSTPSLWKSVDLLNWDGIMSLSRRGLLYNTRSIKIPDRYTSNCNEVALDSGTLVSVFSNIRDLKALEISHNSIDASTMMTVAEECQNLERLFMEYVSRVRYDLITLEDLKPIFGIAKLKHLTLSGCRIQDTELLFTEIAANCPSLEWFEWCNKNSKFPICKFMSNCARLKKLELWGCELITTSDDTCSRCKDMTVFKASMCDFHGLDVCCLLKNSKSLEALELKWNDNIVFSDVAKIPSKKVNFLNVTPVDKNMTLQVLEKAVSKWKFTMLHLELIGWQCNVTTVLKALAYGNKDPKLEVLCIDQEDVDRVILRMFITKCRHLKKLTVFKFVEIVEHKNRAEIMGYVSTL